MWPLLLRPDPRFWLSTSEATGGPLCRFGLTTLTSERRPFDVGLTLTSGMSGLCREVDFLARLQADIRLLPVPAPARVRAEALLLALDVDDLHRLHFDRLVLLAEHQLDGGLHLGLGRVLHDTEDHLLVLVRDIRALFGHDRREQHRHQALGAVLGRGAHPRISSNCVTAPFVSSTWLKRTRLTGSTSRVSSTSTSGRLRDDRNRFSSRLSVTTRTVPVNP